MITRRRLSFQLTPLLDLLLIVIFAQYMEVRHDTTRARQTQQRQQDEIAAQRRAMQVQYDQQREAAASLQAQLDQISRVLSQSFQVSERVLQEITRLRDRGDEAEAARLEAARQQLVASLGARAENSADNYVAFVTRYAEMQKHVTLWELHLQNSGQALLIDANQRIAFSFSRREEFTDRAFQATKALAKPRTLAIILVTYGDTQAEFREAATAAMPELTERLRQDSGGTRWYDFSLLGYRPTGPLLQLRDDVQGEPPRSGRSASAGTDG